MSATSISTPLYYNELVPAGEKEKDGMQYVRLGTTGLVVSRVCLGLMSYSANTGDNKWRDWILDASESQPFIDKAFEAGINFFDTAEMYSDGGSEEFFGEALKTSLSKSKKFKREDIVVATKIFPGRTITPDSKFGGIQKALSRKAIFDAVDGSLKRLQLDYIDLYQIHRFDPHTSIEETMKALHDVVQSGKVRYIGASSMYAWQFAKMQAVAEKNGWTKFSTMQNFYNAIYREEEREMLPYCVDTGVASIPWSPLARGYLTRTKEQNDTARAKSDASSVTRGQTYYADSDDKIVETVHKIADKRGLKAAQVALAWLLQKPGVAAPIVGATKIHHLEDAIAGVKIKLTEEEMKQIEADYQPHPITGHS